MRSLRTQLSGAEHRAPGGCGGVDRPARCQATAAQRADQSPSGHKVPGMPREHREKRVVPLKGKQPLWSSCRSAACNENSVTQSSTVFDPKPGPLLLFSLPWECKEQILKDAVQAELGWPLVLSFLSCAPLLCQAPPSVLGVCTGSLCSGVLSPPLGLPAYWMRTGPRGHFRPVPLTRLQHAPQGRGLRDIGFGSVSDQGPSISGFPSG